MQKITREEKKQVQALIDKYVRAGQPLSVQQYKRLASWLAGLTYAEIAEEEGVKPQAIGYSIKRDSKRILEWGGDLPARDTA